MIPTPRQRHFHSLGCRRQGSRRTPLHGDPGARLAHQRPRASLPRVHHARTCCSTLVIINLAFRSDTGALTLGETLGRHRALACSTLCRFREQHQVVGDVDHPGDSRHHVLAVAIAESRFELVK